MIRLFYRSDLPVLAYVGQDGDCIAVAVHSYAHLALSTKDREILFNRLMAEMERSGSRTDIQLSGAAGMDVIVHLDDVRERRAICRTLAEGLAVPY